jgi:hypothetical protein
MDLRKKGSQIAILTEAGELIEKRLRTEHERLHQFFAGRPKGKVLMEASTISEWVARLLEGLGHEVIVADPNYAPMYAQRSRRVKTDRRDAQALAEACRFGSVPPGPPRLGGAAARTNALDGTGRPGADSSATCESGARDLEWRRDSHTDG